MNTQNKSWWLAALAAFLVAAITGVWLRGTLELGWSSPFITTNIRHAHSHLMYFGWVTPALLVLIWRNLAITPPARTMWALIVLGFLCYVPFLLDGYGFMAVGASRLPVSISLSTASMLVWYVAIRHYARHRKDTAQHLALPFFDAAFMFLTAASFGAWALGVVQAIGPDNPVWFQLALHLFLDTFALGWLLMGVLGLAVQTRADELSGNQVSRIVFARRLLCVGIPFLFLLAVHPSLLPPAVRLLGSVGAMLTAAGLGFFLSVHGWPKQRSWRLSLILLVPVITALVALSIPLVATWGLAHGLRIPFLHVVLLGVVSTGLVAAVESTWPRIHGSSTRWFRWSVLFLLLSLVPLTGWWPGAWGGAWTGWVSVAGSASVAAAVPMMIRDMLSLSFRSTP